MKAIGTVTIGKLIEAHYEKDEVKFKAYAEHIADALKEQGDERGERIIRSRINGTYKNKPKVEALDSEEIIKQLRSGDIEIPVFNPKKFSVTEHGNLVKSSSNFE